MSWWTPNPLDVQVAILAAMKRGNREVTLTGAQLAVTARATHPRTLDELPNGTWYFVGPVAEDALDPSAGQTPQSLPGVARTNTARSGHGAAMFGGDGAITSLEIASGTLTYSTTWMDNERRALEKDATFRSREERSRLNAVTMITNAGTREGGNTAVYPFQGKLITTYEAGRPYLLTPGRLAQGKPLGAFGTSRYAPWPPLPTPGYSDACVPDPFKGTQTGAAPGTAHPAVEEDRVFLAYYNLIAPDTKPRLAACTVFDAWDQGADGLSEAAFALLLAVADRTLQGAADRWVGYGDAEADVTLVEQLIALVRDPRRFPELATADAASRARAFLGALGGWLDGTPKTATEGLEFVTTLLAVAPHDLGLPGPDEVTSWVTGSQFQLADPGSSSWLAADPTLARDLGADHAVVAARGRLQHRRSRSGSGQRLLPAAHRSQLHVILWEPGYPKRKWRFARRRVMERRFPPKRAGIKWGAHQLVQTRDTLVVIDGGFVVESWQFEDPSRVGRPAPGAVLWFMDKAELVANRTKKRVIAHKELIEHPVIHAYAQNAPVAIADSTDTVIRMWLLTNRGFTADEWVRPGHLLRGSGAPPPAAAVGFPSTDQSAAGQSVVRLDITRTHAGAIRKVEQLADTPVGHGALLAAEAPLLGNAGVAKTLFFASQGRWPVCDTAPVAAANAAAGGVNTPGGPVPLEVGRVFAFDCGTNSVSAEFAFPAPARPSAATFVQTGPETGWLFVSAMTAVRGDDGPVADAVLWIFDVEHLAEGPAFTVRAAEGHDLSLGMHVHGCWVPST